MERRLVGDRAELDRLVLAQLPAALRFAIRLTGDRDDAEDLVQEALVKVAQNWMTFRGDATFATWFTRVLINVFRDRLRRRPEPVVRLDPEQVNLVDMRADDPASVAATGELAERVAVEVSRLPPRQREVLVLATYEGYSLAAIAALLEINEQNVYATLSAARARLKARLAPYLGVEEK